MAEAVEPGGLPELLPDQAAAERTAAAVAVGSEPSPLRRRKKVVTSVARPRLDGLSQSLVSLGSVSVAEGGVCASSWGSVAELQSTVLEVLASKTPFIHELF